MKPSQTLMLILFTVCAATRAQVVPSATGPGLPLSGTLRYDLRYTQTAQFYGGSGGDTERSSVSGEVTYANANAARPSTLTYSGGDSWSLSGESEGTGIFQHLMVSQGIVRRDWTLSLSDDVSYMPQAPTTGFSGIPGVGNLPGGPSISGQSILTLNTRSVYNVLTPAYTHILGHATNLSINGSYGILRFPDNNGLEDDSLEVGSQVTRRLDALNSISVQYAYSHFSYPGYTLSMETQSAQFGYQRSWSRRFGTSVSAGPEWVQGIASLQVPSSTGLTVNANANYDAKPISVTLSYVQATSGGAGVLTQVGVHNQDVNADFSRQFGRNLNVSATGSYMRTRGLQQAGLINGQTGVTNGKYGGASATRRLGRYFTVFANYTAVQQSTSAFLPSNAISGLSQVIGFGLGYSPREMYFK